MARNCITTWFTFIISMGFIGCSVAVPEVASLKSISVFSSKSKSPFLQENLGEAFFMSGQCLPAVTGFEFRLDSNAIWTAISANPPTPENNEEYLVGTPEYDVDCSNGTFNFYLFSSTAKQNYTDNGLPATTLEPDIVEFRTTGVPGLPSIVYTRPPPSTFLLQQYALKNPSYIEVGQMLPFRVQLLNVFGNRSRMGTGNSLLTTVTITSLDAPAISVGTLYDSACSSPATTGDLTFAAGEDEILLCYKATSAVAGSTLRLQVSSPGLISQSWDFAVKETYSGIGYLAYPDGYSDLPTVLVKDIAYTFNMGITPLGSSGTVTAYDGNLLVDSGGSSTVSFMRSGSDTECSSVWITGSMSCNTTSINKSFVVKVESSYAASSLTLKVVPDTTPALCSVNCHIYSSPTQYNITNFLPMEYKFEVIEGSASYNQPYFKPQESVINMDQCLSANIGFANEDGNLIPADSTKTFTIGSAMNDVDFYSDSACTASVGNLNTYTLNLGNLTKKIYFQIPDLPIDGIVQWQIDDGSSIYTRPFYVKSSN